jgi:hypothetical protein
MLLPFVKLFDPNICLIIFLKYIFPGKVTQKRQPNPYFLEKINLPWGMILNAESKTVIIYEVSTFPCNLFKGFIKLQLVHNGFIPIEEKGNTGVPFMKIARQWTARNKFSQFFQKIIKIIPPLIEIKILKSFINDASISKVEVSHHRARLFYIVVEEHDGVC